MSKSIYEKALEELTWLLHDEFDDTQVYDKVDEYVSGCFEVLEIGNGRIYL